MSIDNNPFAPKKKAPAAKENDAAPAARLFGQPATNFREDERQFIDTELKRFLDILQKSPGSQIYVKEIIMTALEMQRHDAHVAKQRKMWGDKQNASDTEWLLKQDKIRDGLMKRHTHALEAIGALPKDSLMCNTEAATLSDIHQRYKKELAERRASGNAIGNLSKDAANLASRVGLKPEKYAADPLPAALREEVVAEMESDA